MKTLSENIKPVLAIMVVFFGFLYIYLITFLPNKSTDSQALVAVCTFLGIALNYYLGNTTGMAKKDETINNLTKKNNE